MSDSAVSASRPTRWGVAAVLGLVGAVAIGVIVMAFVWPAATAKPQNLPIGISGPAASVTAVEKALAAQDPAPFVLEKVSSRADAVARIKERTLYGAVLLGDTPEVLVATAAGPAPAQALRAVAAKLQSQIDASAQSALIAQLTAISQALASGQRPTLPDAGSAPRAVPTVHVTDVVPVAAGDPTGAGLAAAAFPLVLGGMLGGIILTLRVQGAIRRLVGLAAFGVAAGVVIVTVMQTWFGILAGSWLLNAAVVALSVTATGALIIGLAALLGPIGIGVGAVITLLVANPIAGAAVPSPFLPGPWGAIGQWFVPGASVTLLRSTSYFPDAATAAQWLTLAAWLVGGVLLTLIGHRRTAAELAPAAPEPEAPPVAA